MSDEYIGQFDSDEDSTRKVTFGKYKGLTPVEILASDPGYITWATSAFPQGWVGSEDIIARALRSVPSQGVHTQDKQGYYRDKSGGSINPFSPEVKAFEEAMLETFGEFPTPYWKTWS